MILGAAQCLHPLAVIRACLVDVLGYGGRPDEADRRDVGVLEDAVDRDPVALDHVEHAVGQTRLGEELGEDDLDRYQDLELELENAFTELMRSSKKEVESNEG